MEEEDEDLPEVDSPRSIEPDSDDTQSGGSDDDGGGGNRVGYLAAAPILISLWQMAQDNPAPAHSVNTSQVDSEKLEDEIKSDDDEVRGFSYNYGEATMNEDAEGKSATMNEGAEGKSATMNEDAEGKSATMNEGAEGKSATINEGAEGKSSTINECAEGKSATINEGAEARSATGSQDDAECHVEYKPADTVVDAASAKGADESHPGEDRVRWRLTGASSIAYTCHSFRCLFILIPVCIVLAIIVTILKLTMS